MVPLTPVAELTPIEQEEIWPPKVFPETGDDGRCTVVRVARNSEEERGGEGNATTPSVPATLPEYQQPLYEETVANLDRGPAQEVKKLLIE